MRYNITKKCLAFLITILMISPLFSQQTPKLPEGYGNARWGTSMDTVKSAIIGRLAYSDDEKVIISKDDNLEYTYGFFYTDPQKAAVENPNNNNQNTPNSILYYVSVKFPYLPIDQVKSKLEAQYGTVTIDNVNKNKGAIGWLGDKTLTLICVDEYEKKQYVSRITYVSRDIIKQINDYENSVFNKTEIEVIRKLNP
jgi:hypothetical protein